MSIRVLVVDDHAVVRTGLRRILDAEPDIETVAEAPNVDRAVFEALEHKPDVVLMDVVMPGKSGIEGLPAVLQAVPEAKVLVLSMQDDPRYVREAFEAGASGYVLKEAADTEVVGAVRAVAGGERYVHPALGARLVQPSRRSGAGPRRIRCQTASARCSVCLRSGIRPGDREDALHLRSDGRDAPSAHHAEAALSSRAGSSATRSPRGCSRSDRGPDTHEHVAWRAADDGCAPPSRPPRPTTTRSAWSLVAASAITSPTSPVGCR